MLTLQELKQMVKVPVTGQSIPTAKYLQTYGRIIAEERLGREAEITAFQNGYVLYRVSNRVTVFPINNCDTYVYESGKDTYSINAQFFSGEPWYVRLMLEGEDRLSYNQEVKEHGRTVSYSTVPEEWQAMGTKGDCLLEEFVIKESVEEMMVTLTERQRMIISQVF